MKYKKISINLLLIFASLVCTNQVKAANYIFTNIGTLGGSWSSASAINNAGQVVGASTISISSFTPQAFLWDRGQISGLGTLGGDISAAGGINETGQIVGYSYLSGGVGPHPTLWSNNVITDLSPNVAYFSSANDINYLGQIAGNFDNKPTIWSGGNAVNLGTRGGYSVTGAINNAGDIAGYSYDAGNISAHAVFWSVNGVNDLGTLGGTDSYASDINDFGAVVGESYTTGNTSLHATLWSGSLIIDLGTLSGTERSAASAINNHGQIVGYSYSSEKNANFATFWDGNSIIDLNSLLDYSIVSEGWVLTEANDINDNGLIVGNAFNIKSFQSTAFLLSPVPEPTTHAMFLFGLGLIGFIYSYRKA